MGFTNGIHQLDPTAKMDYALCRQETTDKCCIISSGTPRYLLWMDPRPVQGYGAGGLAVCRTRRLCGELCNPSELHRYDRQVLINP